MPRAIAVLSFVACIVGTVPVGAVTVLRCRDADGSVSYRERCPPGASTLERKELAVSARVADQQARDAQQRAWPVDLYAVRDCDACDLVRNLLRAHQVPFREHDAGEDTQAQAALKALTGALSVPVVSVGKTTIPGYAKASLEAALQEAGYLPPPAKAGR